MPSPRVLFSTAAFFARPLAETFGLVADAGYSGIEVMVTKDPASQDAVIARQLASRFGLEIGAIHSPNLLLTRRVWGTDPVVKIERAIAMASDAGVATLVTHPPYRWQGDFRRWMSKALPGVEERCGVVVAVENMFPLRAGGRSIRFHDRDMMDDLEGYPAVTLDTSHAAVSGLDPSMLARRIGDRLRHVHLSDNAGRGWDSHLPPGQGTLDLDGFVDELTRLGFDGAVTLEVDLRRQLSGDEARLIALMATMRERLETRLRVDARA